MSLRLTLTDIGAQSHTGYFGSCTLKPLLEVHNLTSVFQTTRGEITAIEEVAFDVEQGEVLGIVGESGSGKSVTALPQPLARVAAGEVRIPRRGTDPFIRLSYAVPPREKRIPTEVFTWLARTLVIGAKSIPSCNRNRMSAQLGRG